MTKRTGGEAPRDGRDRRWSAHREERRRRILDAALVVLERTPDGTQVQVAQIAAEAGLGRAVLYRHFEDRADLDRAVQQHILQALMDHLVPAFTLSGTIEQTIVRIIGAYVEWAAAHPTLHRVGTAETNDPAHPDPTMETIGIIAGLVAGLVTSGADLFEVQLRPGDELLLRPLVFGIVGQAVGTVRFWLADPGPRPSTDVLAAHMSRSVWFQLEGHARDRGVGLRPDMPLESVLSRLAG